ncbi:hypothetical protein RHSIM_Rhsim12G0101100 [Rhododendron simsii]|uniref:Uncharacterized protein n=1 Tax=Rhododendron simsii TaxID=118357 RepID=A0A834G4I0_RHOSS|nr:hypothetical protein RHSIM_Rhsim12G0101100 [Rhododendron simsii]
MFERAEIFFFLLTSLESSALNPKPSAMEIEPSAMVEPALLDERAEDNLNRPNRHFATLTFHFTSPKSQSLLSIPTTSRSQQEKHDSEDELLEVLEGVVRSSKKTEEVPQVKAAGSLDPDINASALKDGLSNTVNGPNFDKVVNPLSEAMQPPTPKPPDLQRDKFKEKVAELEANKSLSKSAKRRMMRQLKEQSLCSLSGGGH